MILYSVQIKIEIKLARPKHVFFVHSGHRWDCVHGGQHRRRRSATAGDDCRPITERIAIAWGWKRGRNVRSPNELFYISCPCKSVCTSNDVI